MVNLPLEEHTLPIGPTTVAYRAASAPASVPPFRRAARTASTCFAIWLRPAKRNTSTCSRLMAKQYETGSVSTYSRNASSPFRAFCNRVREIGWTARRSHGGACPASISIVRCSRLSKSVNNRFLSRVAANDGVESIILQAQTDDGAFNLIG